MVQDVPLLMATPPLDLKGCRRGNALIALGPHRTTKGLEGEGSVAFEPMCVGCRQSPGGALAPQGLGCLQRPVRVGQESTRWKLIDGAYAARTRRSHWRSAAFPSFEAPANREIPESNRRKRATSPPSHWRLFAPCAPPGSDEVKAEFSSGWRRQLLRPCASSASCPVCARTKMESPTAVSVSPA